jgi:hypothetical protein
MATLQLLTYRITLDTTKNGIQRILQGWVTGENLARRIEVSLASGHDTYELPLEGLTASMYVTTPTTHTLSINACEIDYENNKIIYDVLDSDISEAGLVNLQLKIFDNEKILISPSFQLEVWESTISDSQAVLSPSYTALTAALAQAEAYAEKAISQVYIDEDYTLVIEFADGTEYTSTAIKDVIDSLVNGGEIAEGWARGTQEGVPVEEGSPYYHDNASYWSGQAHGYSGMAENAKQYAYGYANDANTAKVAAQGYSTSASGFADEANKWANGKVGETDVPSTAPQYHNNAKYWSEQSQALGNAEYLAAKSYAVGDTGTRTGEDNDNAKYYKERCEQIAASLEGGFIPMGTVLFANLPVSDIGEGWMYNVSDSFTSDSRFEDGGGIEYPAGTNVYYTAQSKWDCLSSPYQTAGNTAYDNTESGLTADDVQDAIDELASDKISKSETSGLVKNDGTIDTTTYVSDISGKADKVSGATNGNFAGLDSSGNLTDSSKKASDFQTALTFDNVPTQNSSNPVKSGGVYDSVKTVDDKFNALNTRARTNITTKLSNLSMAISEQNLAKYGYSIGDYFTGPSGYTYFLAQLNPFKGTTTPDNISTNHIGLVVDTHATTKWLAGGDASAVGYAGSDLHAYLTGTVLNNIKSDMLSLFGGSTGLEHLLKHSKLLTTALENWGWSTDQYISALTESQVYGHREWSGNNYQEGEAVNQLEIFRKFKWTEIFGSEYPWLRNLYSATAACGANDRGYAANRALTDARYAAGLINFY